MKEYLVLYQIVSIIGLITFVAHCTYSYILPIVIIHPQTFLNFVCLYKLARKFMAAYWDDA